MTYWISAEFIVCMCFFIFVFSKLYHSVKHCVSTTEQYNGSVQLYIVNFTPVYFVVMTDVELFTLANCLECLTCDMCCVNYMVH